jgi:hypothetical protein
MAILHVFTAIDPNKVGPFPPSVVASSWADALREYMSQHSTSADVLQTALTPASGEYGAYFFETEADYEAFKSTYTLTDATLISDINEWKAAHNIVYEHKVYSITDAGTGTAFV